jgi:hypothetical protein
MTMLIEAIPIGNTLDVTTHFVVPYIRWGMKNPSTLFLRVGDQVNIDVRAKGEFSRTANGAPDAAPPPHK